MREENGTVHVSTSSVSLWKQCQRKWAWKYVYGLDEKVSVARRMGSAFSHLLDSYYSSAVPISESISSYYGELIEQSETQGVVDELQIEKDIVGRLAEGYTKQYPEPMVREVEFNLEVPTTGIEAKGFLDGVLESGPLVEDKLLNPRYWGQANVNALPLDEQVLQYFWARRMLGHSYKSLEYRVTCKPLLRRKVGESIGSFTSRIADDISVRGEFYFRSYAIPSSDKQIDLFEEDLIRSIEEQKVAKEKDSYGYNGKHCSDYGGCLFIDQCKELVR